MLQSIIRSFWKTTNLCQGITSLAWVMRNITRFCVKRNYLDAVILKYNGKEQVALLYSHMTIVLQVLSLDLTTNLGNVTFQHLFFMCSIIDSRLTFPWSQKLECFLIKQQELCPFTMSLIKWPSCIESRPHSISLSLLGFHFRIGKMTHQWPFVIFQS